MTGKDPNDTFPLTAVVGQADLKLALLLNALDPGIGGVLLRGQKGSGKTTAARGLAALLPGQAPFVELPLGATEDRLVGTIDLRAALTRGEKRFQPGLLHEAHQGVLYVDEVNLLPDHLVDVLLDVAASGVNRMEREGISESHPSRFVLVGSMNPEEGELRPQLLDRFGLAVDVLASSDPEERAMAVERRLGFESDPGGFLERWSEEEESLRSTLSTTVTTPVAELDPVLVRTVSRLCAEVGAEGLRADLVICRAAAALAGWEETEVGLDQVRRVAPLALAHRRRRSPLDEHGIDPQVIEQALASASGSTSNGAGSGQTCSAASPDAVQTPKAAQTPDAAQTPKAAQTPDAVQTPKAAQTPDATQTPVHPPGDSLVPPNEPTPVIPLRPSTKAGPFANGAVGRRSNAEGSRGRLVGDRAPDGPPLSVALAATARAAAARRATAPEPPLAARGPVSDGAVSERAHGSGEALVETEDVREAVRHQRVANLIVFAVDASGSMGAHKRMEAVKGAVISLLIDAYQRRDRVALVTFRDERAEVVLRPTSSVEVARARLAALRTGGRTPLAAGIKEALLVAESSRAGNHAPLLVVVSDGRATAAPPGLDPVEAAMEAARSVRTRALSAAVVDAEEGTARLGLTEPLADAMGARYLTLDQLSGGSLAEAVTWTLATAASPPGPSRPSG